MEDNKEVIEDLNNKESEANSSEDVNSDFQSGTNESSEDVIEENNGEARKDQ